MIYLDTTTRKLQAVLAACAASVNPTAVVCFFDVPTSSKVDYSAYRGATTAASLSHITDVDICPAPLQTGFVRNIKYMSFYNAQDTALRVRVKIDDGGTDRVIKDQSLSAGESLVYEDGAGWLKL